MAEKRRFPLILAVIFLLITVIVSRLVSGLYSLTMTDIAYADWVPMTLGYVLELLTAIYIAIAYCTVGYMTYLSCGRRAVISVTAVTFFDLLLRFLIDYFTGAITGSELFAAIWLFLQFLYELVFIILAFIVARMMREKFAASEEKRIRAKYAPEKAVRGAILLYLASRVFSEVLYLIDFLTTYDDITNTEIASIIKSFLMIFIVYGAAAIVFAQLFGGIFKKRIR